MQLALKNECSTKTIQRKFDTIQIEQNNVFELCKELYNISFDSAILSSKEIAKKILNFKK